MRDRPRLRVALVVAQLDHVSLDGLDQPPPLDLGQAEVDLGGVGQRHVQLGPDGDPRQFFVRLVADLLLHLLELLEDVVDPAAAFGVVLVDLVAALGRLELEHIFAEELERAGDVGLELAGAEAVIGREGFGDVEHDVAVLEQAVVLAERRYREVGI